MRARYAANRRGQALQWFHLTEGWRLEFRPGSNARIRLFRLIFGPALAPRHLGHYCRIPVCGVAADRGSDPPNRTISEVDFVLEAP